MLVEITVALKAAPSSHCQIFGCGFESGAVRVFHVSSTSILSEHLRVHFGSKVTSIVFAPTGERLISLCEKGDGLYSI